MKKLLALINEAKELETKLRNINISDLKSIKEQDKLSSDLGNAKDLINHLESALHSFSNIIN